jgi:hypothetical protein
MPPQDGDLVTHSQKQFQITARCTFGVQRDLFLLPFFLKYYQKLGISDLRIILHSRLPGTEELETAIDLLKMHGLEPAQVWITQNWNTGDNASRHREIVNDLSDDAWILSADADEFHLYPEPLVAFISHIEQLGINAVEGRLVDYVASDWRLHPPSRTLDLFQQCPVRANPFFRFPGNPGKVMLHKKFVQTSPGHHNYLSNDINKVVSYPETLSVAHFKWFAAVEQKYIDPTKIAHHSNSWEYQLYQKQIQRNFSGYGRLLNIILHTQFGQTLRPAVDILQSLTRRMTQVIP